MTSSQLTFYENTNLGGYAHELGLVDLLFQHLDNVSYQDIFQTIQIVVPNHAIGSWLRDKVTLKYGICANLDFVVLLGPVLNKIYLANNPTHKLFDMNEVKYIIYDYLCKTSINTPDAQELNQYIYVHDILDKFRVYQLAIQLAQIFQEYIYLRTEELCNINTMSLPQWQKQILLHVLHHQTENGNNINFVHMYNYFKQINIATLILPQELFIFGLTSIYPSQLHIVQKLSQKIQIYWYYQPCSYEYYGDLLSNLVKNKLEKKVLKYPELSIDDLYLDDSNPLLANLGQQSREFIELLRAHDITVYDETQSNVHHTTPLNNMLHIIQQDIHQMKYRIRSEYRLSVNADNYIEPIALLDSADNSIKINSCHNKMREVQVMFNEIANILNQNPSVTLDQIFVCAPDIDDYTQYIRAVFDNEEVEQSDGKTIKIPYNITGHRKYNDYKVVLAIKLLLNAPYNLTSSCFIEILNQNILAENLAITNKDIERIKQWLKDNAIYSGYTADDYTQYGFINYPMHSFKQWLSNMVLGACMPNTVFTDNQQLPVYKIDDNRNFAPYDNIDSGQIQLCNTMIMLIEQLEILRQAFYIDHNNYREVTVVEISCALSKLSKCLIKQDDALLSCQSFLSYLYEINLSNTINLPIINLIIDDYLDAFKSKINLNGNITCTSMRYMRNIPYGYVYVLGMNFGEYPQGRAINQLSLLAHQWYLADRNYNLEDKQVFLDILLATKVRLYLSYIGRSEIDNTPIVPSPILQLLLNTIGQSFTDFWGNTLNDPDNLAAISTQHALHPFYNNKQTNFSYVWHRVSRMTHDEVIDNRWDFMSHNTLMPTETPLHIKSIAVLANTFIYTNANLYKTYKVYQFNKEIELQDEPIISFNNKELAKNLAKSFAQYSHMAPPDELYQYLTVAGIIDYQHIGKSQFDFYHNLYEKYIKARGDEQVDITLHYNLLNQQGNEIPIVMNDTAWIENNNIIIITPFELIKNKDLTQKHHDLPYAQQIIGLVTYLVIYNNAKITKLKTDTDVTINGIILREINANGGISDYSIKVTNVSLIKNILSYYCRSLNNPVLIHKQAIIKYVASSRLNRDNDPVLEAQKIYENKYKNTELDKIKQDICFNQIATNYFTYMQQTNGINDIKQIGQILMQLQET